VCVCVCVLGGGGPADFRLDEASLSFVRVSAISAARAVLRAVRVAWGFVCLVSLFLVI